MTGRWAPEVFLEPAPVPSTALAVPFPWSDSGREHGSSESNESSWRITEAQVVWAARPGCVTSPGEVGGLL